MTTSIEHPGKELRRVFDNLGWHDWTLDKIAAEVGCTRPTISNLLLGKRSIGPRLAVRIARATETEARDWMDRQSQWNLSKLMRKEGKKE